RGSEGRAEEHTGGSVGGHLSLEGLAPTGIAVHVFIRLLGFHHVGGEPAIGAGNHRPGTADVRAALYVHLYSRQTLSIQGEPAFHTSAFGNGRITVEDRKVVRLERDEYRLLARPVQDTFEFLLIDARPVRVLELAIRFGHPLCGGLVEAVHRYFDASRVLLQITQLRPRVAIGFEAYRDGRRQAVHALTLRVAQIDLGKSARDQEIGRRVGKYAG